MNEEIRDYLGKYPDELKKMYHELRTLLIESVDQEVEEKLWAKLPSYYIGEKFVRLIPFKDHINVEAKTACQHEDELEKYKITPKGMLQIYLQQEIPSNILKEIFKETLLE